jgi:diphosphomevalonate decarboxylase
MRATARAQPNIALIKYWGKRDRDRNLPAVGSISLTLDDLYTTMDVELDGGLDRDELHVNGRTAQSMLPRVARCLDLALSADRLRARVTSESNFPIAAGLASSASSFAALIVAASAAGGRPRSVDELAGLAGRASGSAARSLYGGFVELRNDGDGIAISTLLEGEAWPLRIVAAVTSQAPKPVSSGEAMELSRKTSPFYSRWIEEQDMDLSTARDAITVRDFGKLASIAEHNCLVYWNAATLACLETVRALQAEGVDAFFTIDAGPQVKVICPPGDEPRVVDALSNTDGVEAVLASGIGSGAALVNRD